MRVASFFQYAKVPQTCSLVDLIIQINTSQFQPPPINSHGEFYFPTKMMRCYWILSEPVRSRMCRSANWLNDGASSSVTLMDPRTNERTHERRSDDSRGLRNKSSFPQRATTQAGSLHQLVPARLLQPASSIRLLATLSSGAINTLICQPDN